VRFHAIGAAVLAALLLAACGQRAAAPVVESTPSVKSASPSEPAAAAVPAAPAVWTAETTVGAIVAARPETARVFELVGIDYCCGGEAPLGDVAKSKSIEVERLLSALAVIGASATAPARDWTKVPLPDLTDHLVATHHAWLRRELPRIRQLVEKVSTVHGEGHAELLEVRKHYRALHKAIGPHLEEEEQQLFPAVEKLAAGERGADVAALLKSMRTDHDDVGAALHSIRDLTAGFRVPDDACPLYRQMLTALQALEDDLHQHVHLENNVLLPRALAVLNAR
jgi:regulator of cell morphogenesis and NO signaling